MKIDMFNHILPKRFFDKMTEANPNLVDIGKRFRNIPVLVDLEARFRVMDLFDDYVQVISLCASSSNAAASYAISVRQVSALHATSFRSHLAVGTLVVRLTLPPAGRVDDLASLTQKPHLQVFAPCRAHPRKAGPFLTLLFIM
jgi:hypothetical protein